MEATRLVIGPMSIYLVDTYLEKRHSVKNLAASMTTGSTSLCAPTHLTSVHEVDVTNALPNSRWSQIDETWKSIGESMPCALTFAHLWKYPFRKSIGESLRRRVYSWGFLANFDQRDCHFLTLLDYTLVT